MPNDSSVTDRYNCKIVEIRIIRTFSSCHDSAIITVCDLSLDCRFIAQVKFHLYNKTSFFHILFNVNP